MAPQLVPEHLNTAGARLPAAYEAAKTALAQCASIDECQNWANKAQALASYARQADDDTLQKQATRIQSRAVRRCGELLREIDGRGGDRRDAAGDQREPLPYASKKDGAVPFAPTRTEAARQAGMSERQQKTAVRVANVPREAFELAVESDEPPTVTKLADMGRQSTARQDEPAPPGFQAAIHLMGLTRRLAELVQANAPDTVAAAVADHNRAELRRYVAQCRRWLTAIAPQLREDRHGL